MIDIEHFQKSSKWYRPRMHLNILTIHTNLVVLSKGQIKKDDAVMIRGNIWHKLNVHPFCFGV